MTNNNNNIVSCLTIPHQAIYVEKILNYLNPEDLLSFCKLNKAWKNYMYASNFVNRLFFELCNRNFFLEDDFVGGKSKKNNSTIQKWGRKEKLKNWRHTFIRLVPPPKTIQLKKERSSERRVQKSWEIEMENDGEGNHEDYVLTEFQEDEDIVEQRKGESIQTEERIEYKQLKNKKPRGKKPNRDNTFKTDIHLIVDDSFE